MAEESKTQRVQCRVPFVYALTSEMDDDVIERIKAAGFKRIYHMLDQKMVMEVKRDAGIHVDNIVEPVVDEAGHSIVWQHRGHSKYLGQEEISYSSSVSKQSSQNDDGEEKALSHGSINDRTPKFSYNYNELPSLNRALEQDHEKPQEF